MEKGRSIYCGICRALLRSENKEVARGAYCNHPCCLECLDGHIDDDPNCPVCGLPLVRLTVRNGDVIDVEEDDDDEDNARKRVRDCLDNVDEDEDSEEDHLRRRVCEDDDNDGYEEDSFVVSDSLSVY